MSKPRQGPALFDLIPDKKQQEAHRILRIPGTWSEEEGVADSSERESTPAPTAASAPVDPAAGTQQGGLLGSVLKLDGQRITLSVTSYGAAIAMFLVLVVLSAAFTLGQRSGVRSGYMMGMEQVQAGRDSGGELETARQSPPVAGLIDPLLENAPAPQQPVKLTGSAPVQTEKSASAPSWQRDHTYVVAQEFPSSKVQDASVAQSFLSRHGIDAVVVPQNSGGAWLMTTQGYNHKDPLQKKQADLLMDKVRSVGKAFYAQGGGYKMEGYYKTLKGDRW